MPRSSAKARAPAERGRLETAPRMTTAARRTSQPTRGATGDATSFEIGGAGETTGATVATTGAGRSMDGPSCARTGVAVRTMAADSMKAATRATRRPSMVHKVASQPPAVKVCSDQCREHMICPLPRANEMSALQARWDRAMSNKEGAHALSRGRRGAGHETTGGHLPSLGGDADVVAGRRYFGNRPPQPATLAGALSGRRGPRAV